MMRACAPLLAAALLVPRAARGTPPSLPCGPAGLERAVALRLRRPLTWSARTLRLDSAILDIAHRAGIPVSIVSVAPVPQAKIPAGRLTPAALLGELAAAAPGYSWRRRGGVAWFTYGPLRRRRQNFLNWRLPRVRLAGPVGLFLPQLTELTAASPSLPGAMVIAGPTLPGLGCQLPRRTLEHVMVRSVLSLAMRSAPQFSSVVVFPRLPRTRGDAMGGLASWRWIPLAQAPAPPIPGALRAATQVAAREA